MCGHQWSTALFTSQIPKVRSLLALLSYMLMLCILDLPYRDIDANPIKLYDEISSSIVSDDDEVQQIFVVCRRGNDSRLACIALNAVATKRHAKAPVEFVNVSGGLRAWAADVDGSFPVY